MKSETRRALQAIAEKGIYGSVSFTQAEAKSILAREEGAPDLVTKMDPRVPSRLARIEAGSVLGLVAFADAQVLALEVERLRVERDRMYWATEVVRNRIAELERQSRAVDPWDEVSRG